MKKYTILFALLIGMILVAAEAVPQDRAFSQSPTGCYDKSGRPIACPQNPDPGVKEKPGPKNKPVVVTVIIPHFATATPTPLMIMPKPFPYPFLYPYPYPKPVIPHIVTQNACVFGPCWLFGFLGGDPVELLAGGGFIVFLLVIGFVFFRGRITPGGGKSSHQ